jgi:methionyl-tRNA formyltransferase|uniref:methionyl-tRNA formyltransferase n=1 Tax=Polynucleobacter sp. TaxID=2029855 RepID=UPI004047AC00
MKIVFAGTPDFAAYAMRAIGSAGHQIVLALTQPDRRAGRGMHLQASPVKALALENNIPVLQPVTLKRDQDDIARRAQAQEAYQQLLEIEFDVMVVVAYGLILPQDILDIASRNNRYGCFNIHASLLPRWRGAAPIQRAIQAGDLKTGVSIMRMDAGLDTGATTLIEELVITVSETSTTLHDRLASLGAKLIVQTLNDLEAGFPCKGVPQPNTGITYAEKILKSESEIDWRLSAIDIDRQIRAFNPFPGSTSSIGGEQLKFWRSCLPDKIGFSPSNNVGEVLGVSKDSVYIQCGDGPIEVIEMQKAGGKKMSAAACLEKILIEGKKPRFDIHANKNRDYSGAE